ncbi:MAG TPA: transglycosylase SLT domain-containing protein, partial [Longimicrobiales bacterium]
TAAVRAQLTQARPELGSAFGWRVRTLGLEQARDFRRGVALADSVAHKTKVARMRALAYARAGRMRLQLNDSAGARKSLLAAAEASVASDGAREAADQLSHFKALRASELRTLARVARARGQSSTALRYYRQARQKMRPGDERARLVLETGRLLFASRQYDALRKELKPLARGSGALAGEAQLLIGRAELRDRNGQAAISALRRSLASKASSRTRLEAAFLIADLAQDAANSKDADSYFRRVIALAPHSEHAALAYMRRGGAAYARGDFKKATEIFQAFGTVQKGRDHAAQAKYWLARSLAETGDSARSRVLLTEISQGEPYSYYGVLARRVTGGAPPLPAAGPESTPEALRAAVTRARVVRLLRELDLDDAASFEAGSAREALKAMPGGSHAYAEAVQKLGGNAAGIEVGRQILAEGEWNSRLLRIVYPFPYRNVISREARKNGLKPDFVAAFIRQESMFEPRARSRAGALGLMQLMPQTARALRKGVSESELLEPDVNIRIGSAHLRALLQEYGGHTERLIAAYNAGGTPVTRWSKFPESRDPQLFVERIPYDETREYVKIVQRNAWLYSWLYDTE